MPSKYLRTSIVTDTQIRSFTPPIALGEPQIHTSHNFTTILKDCEDTLFVKDQKHFLYLKIYYFLSIKGKQKDYLTIIPPYLKRVTVAQLVRALVS